MNWKYIFFCLLLGTGAVAAQENKPGFLEVSVDNLVIDTRGLVAASNSLSGSIDGLSQSIEKLSANSRAFSAEEKQSLIDSANSVEQASRAIEELALKLPQMSADLTAKLPVIVEQSQTSVGELSGGLLAASASVTNIVEHLPEATENAKVLVDSALSSAMAKFTIYALIIIAVFVLALILVFRYLFKTYVEPVTNLLAPLADAPEHFDNLSRHMKDTSENMLLLKAGKKRHSFIGMPPRSR